ncbi:MAG: N-acetyltransferase [Bacteroidota bacterium]|nr:N-acetyltransferase [Bacteroidota bacterium]
MVVGIAEKEMSVYHTEFVENMEGIGIVTKLVKNLAIYAREHQLMVVPLCPFVKSIFKNSPAEYEDIWKKV